MLKFMRSGKPEYLSENCGIKGNSYVICFIYMFDANDLTIENVIIFWWRMS